MTNLEKAIKLLNANEVSMRTCWECNSAHKYLKEAKGLFFCFSCERWFMNGNYLKNEKFCKLEFEE